MKVETNMEGRKITSESLFFSPQQSSETEYEKEKQLKLGWNKKEYIDSSAKNIT